MTILEAKEELRRSIEIYLDKDKLGEYTIPFCKQRPIFMIGAPGIGKTAIVEQIAAELGIGLVSYSMTHHTRQSAIGLPFISQKEYAGEEMRVSEYTVSEIIASVYTMIERTGNKNGILFLDEINCVSETLAPAILQFLQYKTFGNHALPKGWIIVSAGNPPQYNKSVRDFDIATRDRLKYVYVEEDFACWKKYAYDKGVHGAIISFIEVNKGWFYRIRTTADGPQFATARGWEDLSYAIRLYEKKGFDVDYVLVSQYIMDRDIGRRFVSFYDLYRKYREDYQIPEILSGKREAKVLEQAKSASFDERISFMELLAETMTQEICAALEEQAVLEASARELRRIKKAADQTKESTMKIKDMLDAAILDGREQLQKAALTGLTLHDEMRTLKLSMELLQEMHDKLDLSREGEKAFAAVKRIFDGRARKQASRIDTVRDHIENAILFLVESFGEGQELIYFMTVLTANRHSSTYISRFGCDAYARFNNELLLFDAKDLLKQEIKAGQEIYI